MAFQRYPLSTAQKISQQVRQSLALPPLTELAPAGVSQPVGPADSLDALGDLFRLGDPPTADGLAPNQAGCWYVSTINPAEALFKLPGLWLKPGIRLVSYLQRQPGSGLGATWAVPELLSTTEQLEAAINLSSPDQLPQPQGALPALAEALEGDGSLASFLAASIFVRELKEFGRSGQHIRWGHHRLIDAVPPQISWQWRSQAVADFGPRVAALADGQVAVEFFSCRVARPIALFRHVDRYGSSSYQAQTSDQVVALPLAAGPT